MGGATHRLLLVVMVLATFVSVVNQSMVNVAVPLIREEFGATEGQVGWVATGYLLVFAVGIPLYGRVSDLYSPRATFCLGLSGFAAGSLLCALAPSLPILVAGRVFQAAGAAAIPALSFGLVAKVLPSGSRGAALGAISSSIGAGAAFGPVFGGLLLGVADWHSLFYATLFLTVALLPAAFYVLPSGVPGAPDDTSGDAPSGAPDGPASEEPVSVGRLDLPSGLFLALAAGLLLFGVTQGQASGLLSPVTLGSLAVAALCAAAFARRIRAVPEPFVSPELLANRGFLAASSVGFLAQFSNVCSLFLIPILLVEVGGFSGLVAGLVLAPGAVVVAVFSPLAGRLSDRLGSRAMISAGLVAMLFSGLFISSFGAEGSPYLAALGMLVLGVGFAALNSPAANAASATLSPAAAGAGLGIYQLCFFLGAGFGPVVSGAFLAFRRGSEGLNPLYTTGAAPFSDAFLVGIVAVLLAFVAVLGVTRGNGGKGAAG